MSECLLSQVFIKRRQKVRPARWNLFNNTVTVWLFLFYLVKLIIGNYICFGECTLVSMFFKFMLSEYFQMLFITRFKNDTENNISASALQSLVSTKKSHILKQPWSFQLKIWYYSQRFCCQYCQIWCRLSFSTPNHV